jgi:predicted acetyltransferase
MIQNIAFMGSHDYTEEIKNPAEHAEGHEAYWGAFADSGKMIACMEVLPYAMMFDGHRVKMAGIGGVASLPEFRRAGCVRQIFAESMKTMREEGYLFSYLYPFSHAFYRKFGYELCNTRNIVTFRTEDFKWRAPNGALEQFQKGGDVSEYMRVGERFSEEFNLSVIRDEKQFRNVIDKDPHSAGQYAYLWRGDDGEAGSYIIFSPEKKSDEHVMALREFAWTDRKSLLGMLSALTMFSNPYALVKWDVPPTINPHALIPEASSIESRIECFGMNRVVDVQGALSLMKAPEGEGRAVISVSDEFLAWNSGMYALEWSSGSMSVIKTYAEADMRVSANRLVQLMCGFVTPEIALLSGTVDIDGDIRALNRLFPAKRLYITERF